MRRRAIGSRTLTPNRNAAPLVAFTKPSRTFIVVVLPAPFGPRKPKTSPAWTLRFRSFTASFLPGAFFCAGYSTRKFLVSKIVSTLAFDRQAALLLSIFRQFEQTKPFPADIVSPRIRCLRQKGLEVRSKPFRVSH